MKIYIVYNCEGEHTKALADSIADSAQEVYAVIAGLFKINFWSQKEVGAHKTAINEMGKVAIHSPDKSHLVLEGL